MTVFVAVWMRLFRCLWRVIQVQRMRPVAVFAMALVVAAVSSGARAGDAVSLVGLAGDGLWSSAANWFPHMPTAADFATIPSGASVTADVDVSINSVLVGTYGSSNCSSLTIQMNFMAATRCISICLQSGKRSNFEHDEHR